MSDQKRKISKREIAFSESCFNSFKKCDYEWVSFKRTFHEENPNSQGVVFYKCNFKKSLYIKDNVVQRGRDFVVKFIGCEFDKNLVIKKAGAKYLFFDESCIFKSGVKIELVGEETHDNILFINSVFKENFIIINTSNIEKTRIIIKSCVFDKLFFAKSVNFKSDFSLEESTFNSYLPNLINSTFNYGIDLNLIKFNENKILKNLEKYDTNVEYKTLNARKNYDDGIIDLALDLDVESKTYDLCNISRNLKNLAAENGDFIREMDFFAIESQARAVQVGGAAKTLSNLYKCVSNYGRAISKPVYCLLITFVIMWFINYCYAVDWKFWKVDSFYKETTIVTMKYTLPLALGFNDNALKDAFIIFGENSKPGFWFNILYLAQSVFCTTLWFLFFLSVRNRFKIG